MPRLFVAVWPPPEVVAELASLDRPEVSGVRWTSPEHWHVTLRFLGEAGLDVAVAALATVDARAVEAVLGPTVRRLGDAVVQVPVAGLDDLAAAVGEAFAEVGEPRPERRFHGHLTLARLKRTRRCPLLGVEVSATFPVTEVALVRSTTDRAGANYVTVATRRLAS